MSKLPPAMAEALRLTRAGDLAGATALIQSTLSGRTSGPVAGEPPAIDAPTLDLRAERVTTSPFRAAPPADVTEPRGAFTPHVHVGPAGTLGYRLYVPAGARLGMPLVVMLHGCTQNPEDFARGTGMNALADELGFLVAYPGQARGANPQGCWNWFRPGDQMRDAGEPALIAGITREVMAAHGVDPARVYVAGLSAGGAAAANMGAAYPDLYAAIGVHSGLAAGAARDLPGAMAAMRSGAAAGGAGGFVPVITFHGDRDPTVHEANARQIVAAAGTASGKTLRTETEEGRGPAGRRYTRAIGRDADGTILIEQWTIHGGGHAWSGGAATGSYTDPSGPDASRAMLRFFLDHRLAGA